MTTEEVRDLVDAALHGWHAQRAPGDPIKNITTVGATHVVITFTDGSMARLDITVAPAPEARRS